MEDQSHQDNKTETCKSIEKVNMNLCCMCRINNEKKEFVSMVHKWREYGGYSKYEYPRYFCSTDCLEIYERDYRCNHCHIVSYEWYEHKKGPDGFTYCYDEITIGDKPCYYIKYNICFSDLD
jgi:hypothetical protein